MPTPKPFNRYEMNKTVYQRLEHACLVATDSPADAARLARALHPYVLRERADASQYGSRPF